MCESNCAMWPQAAPCHFVPVLPCGVWHHLGSLNNGQCFCRPLIILFRGAVTAEVFFAWAALACCRLLHFILHLSVCSETEHGATRADPARGRAGRVTAADTRRSRRRRRGARRRCYATAATVPTSSVIPRPSFTYRNDEHPCHCLLPHRVVWYTFVHRRIAILWRRQTIEGQNFTL